MKQDPALTSRILSGLAVCAICIPPFVLGGWWFAVLAALFGGLMAREWVRMSDRTPTVAAYVLIFAALFGSLALGAMGYWKTALLWTIGLALLAVGERARRSKRIWAGMGLIYIVTPCLAFFWIRETGPDNGWFDDQGFLKVFYLAVVVIFVDVGAYFVGSNIGGPKLMPTLSPNKTWSGFFGGLVTGALAGVVWFLIIAKPLWIGAALAIPVGLLAVMGDALESALKRHLGVKDTGTMIPGHGGILDRVDSYVLVGVASAPILLYWPHIWPV